MTRDDIAKIMEDVKVNRAKMEACSRHRFAETHVRIGQRLTCLECGCEMGLTHIGDYIRGYQAHGGNAADIWPAFATRPRAERGRG